MPVTNDPSNMGTSAKKDNIFVRIEKQYLIIPKTLYFLMSLSLYSCYAFRGKFFLDVLHFDPSSFAMIMAGCFLIIWFGCTFWNYISDLTLRPKRIMVICVVVMMLAFNSYYFYQRIPEQYQKPMAIVVYCVHILFSSAVLPLMDATCVKMLIRRGHHADLYGRQAVWGTIGYGFVTYLVGKVIDAEALKNHAEIHVKYNPLHWILIISSFLFLLAFIVFVPPDDPVNERIYLDALRKSDDSSTRVVETVEIKKDNNVKDADSLTQDPVNGSDLESSGKKRFSSVRRFLALFNNPIFLFMLTVTFFCGYAKQMITTIGPLYTEEKVAGVNNPDKKQAVSIRTLSGISSELVILFWGELLLKRINSNTLLYLAVFVMAIRAWGYVVVPEDNPQWLYFIYFIESMRGISAGCLQIAAVQLCGKIGGQRWQATAQGIYNGIYYGLSGFVGMVVTALILKQTGNDYKLNFGVCAIFLSGFLVIAVTVAAIYRMCVKLKK